MANITFDGFSLQDSNFITENINFRSLPTRNIETEQIARRAGVRVLNNQYGARTVKIKGSILADSALDLQTKVDDFNRNISRKDIGVLQINDDRSGQAIVISCDINDSSYNQSYAPFDLSLLMPDPFFYKQQHQVSLTIASGTLSYSQAIAISGSHSAFPAITFTAVSGSVAGYTTTSGVSITYATTNQRVVWSGSADQLRFPYGSTISFDYDNKVVSIDTVKKVSSGAYAEWEPGTANFTVTFSGACQGGALNFYYQPRYL